MAKGAKGKGEGVPAAMQAVYDAVVEITDRVSAEHLNDEYAALARRLAAALSRKRPSPLAQGRAKSWAAGILYALGRVNFLFDPTQEPHMRATELCERVGVSQATASAKAGEIMDRMKMGIFDPEWTLSKLTEQNPFAWIVELSNGMLVDARHLPREVQEEAFLRGLIPYVPDSPPEE